MSDQLKLRTDAIEAKAVAIGPAASWIITLIVAELKKLASDPNLQAEIIALIEKWLGIATN